MKVLPLICESDISPNIPGADQHFGPAIGDAEDVGTQFASDADCGNDVSGIPEIRPFEGAYMPAKGHHKESMRDPHEFCLDAQRHWIQV